MSKVSPNQKPAIFLDRDGTLIHDRGYLRRPEEVCFYPQTVPALRKLQTRFELFVVTNQSGISRGLQTGREVREVNSFVEDWLKDQGIRIRAVYSCPHQRKDGCFCMKPDPFFAQQAAGEFGISLEHSFSVGDHPHDVEFGRRFGGTGLYLLTGHGGKHRNELTGRELVFKDIEEAAEWIVSPRHRRKILSNQHKTTSMERNHI